VSRPHIPWAAALSVAVAAGFVVFFVVELASSYACDRSARGGLCGLSAAFVAPASPPMSSPLAPPATAAPQAPASAEPGAPRAVGRPLEVDALEPKPRRTMSIPLDVPSSPDGGDAASDTGGPPVGDAGPEDVRSLDAIAEDGGLGNASADVPIEADAALAQPPPGYGPILLFPVPTPPPATPPPRVNPPVPMR